MTIPSNIGMDEQTEGRVKASKISSWSSLASEIQAMFLQKEQKNTKY